MQLISQWLKTVLLYCPGWAVSSALLLTRDQPQISAEPQNYYLSILMILTVQNFVPMISLDHKVFHCAYPGWAAVSEQHVIASTWPIIYMYSALHSALRSGSMRVLLQTAEHMVCKQDSAFQCTVDVWAKEFGGSLSALAFIHCKYPICHLLIDVHLLVFYPYVFKLVSASMENV